MKEIGDETTYEIKARKVKVQFALRLKKSLCQFQLNILTKYESAKQIYLYSSYVVCL